MIFPSTLLKKDYLMNFIYTDVQKIYQSWLTIKSLVFLMN